MASKKIKLFNKVVITIDGKHMIYTDNNVLHEYKIREYYKAGINKGNLKQELYFDSFEDMKVYYNDVFVYNDFSLNPTMWKLEGNEGYKRIDVNGNLI